MKRFLPVSIIIASLFFLIFVSNADKRGHIFSTYSHSLNNKPIFQAVSHYEKYCFNRCGTITVFHAYQNGAWQEIADVRRKTSIDFSSNNFKIENENLAYFWFGYKFGATTDGGKTWAIWDASNDGLIKDLLRYDSIEKVTIEPNGTGKMFFNLKGKNQNEISFFKTENYGKTWHR